MSKQIDKFKWIIKNIGTCKIVVSKQCIIYNDFRYKGTIIVNSVGDDGFMQSLCVTDKNADDLHGVIPKHLVNEIVKLIKFNNAQSGNPNQLYKYTELVNGKYHVNPHIDIAKCGYHRVIGQMFSDFYYESQGSPKGIVEMGKPISPVGKAEACLTYLPNGSGDVYIEIYHELAAGIGYIFATFALSYPEDRRDVYNCTFVLGGNPYIALPLYDEFIDDCGGIVAPMPTSHLH